MFGIMPDDTIEQNNKQYPMLLKHFILKPDHFFLISASVPDILNDTDPAVM